MVLSNAERQRRYRQRLKAAATRGSRACLTPEEIADRDAVMSEPLWPVPSDTTQIPTFMGWNRYDWSVAPRALIDHFEMRTAYDGWDRERKAMEAESRRLHEKQRRYVEAIIAEHGEVAKRLIEEGNGGWYRLVAEYQKDPTLSEHKRRRRKGG